MSYGTKDDPWRLVTPTGTTEYTMYRDHHELVCVDGSTTVSFREKAIDDLHEWLATMHSWVPLSSVEAWSQKHGHPGEVATFLPPLLDKLGLAELRGDEVRAV